MSENAKLLELSSVTKCYEAPDGGPAPMVLSGVDLALSAGESLAVVGPSGSGKSTLLNIIGGLDYPTQGRVVLEGKDLATLDDRQLAEVRNRQVGFVFQLHHLLPQCTVLENVLVPTLIAPGDPAAARRRAGDLLGRVGLGDRLAHVPGQLSGGERQRVAVVRALINSPKLLLGDEPTGSLDRAAAENLVELLVELNREQGVTVVMVTHSLTLARRMGCVRELRDGVLQEGNAST